jgi:hypothetical protein
MHVGTEIRWSKPAEREKLSRTMVEIYTAVKVLQVLLHTCTQLHHLRMIA